MNENSILQTLILMVNGLQLFILVDLRSRVSHLERRAMGDTPGTQKKRGGLFQQVDD